MLHRNNNKDIFLTVLYSDIFDFPLSKEELQKYLISSKKIHFSQNIRGFQKYLCFKHGFYYLRRRDDLVEKRLRRIAASKRKILFAKKIAKILAYIPTIRLIGLSGSVAVENAEEYDDIDFYIISSHGTLWITRLLVVILVQLLGVRRRRNEIHTQDKICLNMFVDENRIGYKIVHQNVYMAHEIAHLKPLVIKQDMYNRFLSENKWVQEFLPNAIPKDVQYTLKEIKKNHGYMREIEFLAKKIQLWYMLHHMTKEIITDTILAFHPVDHETQVLKDFKKKFESYAI